MLELLEPPHLKDVFHHEGENSNNVITNLLKTQ
jgi:hypothetical protein